jgi:hypothetical protein
MFCILLSIWSAKAFSQNFSGKWNVSIVITDDVYFDREKDSISFKNENFSNEVKANYKKILSNGSFYQSLNFRNNILVINYNVGTIQYFYKIDETNKIIKVSSDVPGIPPSEIYYEYINNVLYLQDKMAKLGFKKVNE